MSYRGQQRHFGNRKRTRADKNAALVSLLTMRTKPYSDRDIDGIARTHGTTVDAVKAQLREGGKGALIQSEGWG